MTTQPSIANQEPEWEECMRMLAAIPGMPLAERVETIERLLRNPSPGIRPRALRMAAATLTEDKLVAFIRSDDDDVLRNAGLEILKIKGHAAFSLAATLARDEDWDVVLQAVLILDHIRDPRGIEFLRPLLEHPDTNVIQGAIVALGHLGDARTIADLLPFLDRDPWLQIAAIQALGDLRSPQAIPALRALLPDLLLGMFSAEAIARIGGREAWNCLSAHWLAFEESLEAEAFLGLLAHVIEGLPSDPPCDGTLTASLESRLHDASGVVRTGAARCLLACGSSTSDRKALSILGETPDSSNTLPACLTRRKDLCDTLLRSPNPFREWGFLLVSRHPHAAHASALAEALRQDEPPACLEALAEALRQIHDAGVVAATVDFYLTLPPAMRDSLSVALKAHRAMLLGLLEERPDISEEDRLILAARAGVPDGQIVSRVNALDPEGRCLVLPEIVGRRSVMVKLPWKRWIEKEPGIYVPLLADIAGESRVVEVADLLRPFLSEEPPSERLIRAMGALRDRASVPALSKIVESGSALHRAQAMESLGAIGGPQARASLVKAATTLDSRESRLAFRSLARCAVEEDGALFRAAAANADWVIRMSSAEFLIRFPNNENLPVLAALSADPVPAVAQKVHGALDA